MRLNDIFREFDTSSLEGKKVFLYGAGVFGLSVVQILKAEGFNLCGVIDNNPGVQESPILGYEVFPSTVLDNLDPQTTFVIVTATRPNSIRQITAQLSERAIDHIVLSDNYTVQIDISGTCNLRCRSCQVCNAAEGCFTTENRGFMKPDLFEQIIQKLKKELPEVRAVFLYNYGDPMLSPYLPEILDILSKYNLFSVLSTNLSMKVDFEEIIRHNPNCIKISLSGFTQEVYSTTHNNGNIELVKENMRILRRLIDKYNAGTQVIVGYHVYNNNKHEIEPMKSFCKELGFIFQPSQALFCNILKMTGIDSFSEDDLEFINKYYDDPQSILSCKPDYNREYQCGFFDQGLFIDWDGRVMLCCVARRDDAIMPYSYLDKPIDQINSDRKKHYICKECIAYGFRKY